MTQLVDPSARTGIRIMRTTMATATRTGSSTGRSSARAPVSGRSRSASRSSALTAARPVAVFPLSSSVALLADLIHNFGDALTAVPLGIAFFLRSYRGEKLAGLFVVFGDLCLRLRSPRYETIDG